MAREVLALAGVADRVRVVAGLSGEVLPALAAGGCGKAGVVFLDHCKPCLRPDLEVRPPFTPGPSLPFLTFSPALSGSQLAV